ncbi:MAG: hypothetical protein RLZZ522_245 [Verrucomicrobiota bacterium]
MIAVTRGLVAASLLMGGVAGLGACKKPADGAKSALREAGYQATAADWLRASREDNVAALKKFVAAGFAVDTRDGAGGGALHEAARAGAENAADYLLGRGLAVDVRGAAERTPLMVAAIANRQRMVRWLLRQGAAPRLKDHDGYSPLMLAVRENSTKAVGEIAIHVREDLDAALLAAALDGQAEMIDVLTQYGASVYAHMDDGRTPLMLAAQGGHAAAVKMLMELGCSRFTATEDGSTAADYARTEGHPEIAELILKHSAADAFSLESPTQIASAMDAYVEAVAAAIPDAAMDAPAVSDAEYSSARHRPRGPRATPVALDGSTLASTPSAPAAASPLPLVMRHYREREMPLQVVTVADDSATLRLAGATPRAVKLRVGETVPGSTLMVVSVKRRMATTKDNDGRLSDVSVVVVKDTNTGASRSLIAGVPASAHDPVALVEDATSGQRYTARPGQRFFGGDGAEYLINDVGPNQIVIENAATRDVQTLRLRGPRG